DASSHTEKEASLAQVVEHADFLGEPERVIEVQRVNERTETESPGPLREGRVEDRGRRTHPKGGCMVLRSVQRIEAKPIVRFSQPQPILVERGERLIVLVHMVVHAEVEPRPRTRRATVLHSASSMSCISGWHFS